MIIPLEKLIDFDGNAYAITVAVTNRAQQLAILKTPEVEKCNGKVVSLATLQIYTHQVEYKVIE